MKDGLCNYCKKCINKYGQKYRKENLKKIKEIENRYRKNNSDKIKEIQKKYDENNKEKIKDYQKKYQIEYRKSLSDGYVRRVLIQQGFPEKYITPEIIESRRALMKLNRESREHIRKLNLMS